MERLTSYTSDLRFENTMSNFVKYDAGIGKRSASESGDCQVRALSTTLGLTYEAAWSLLYTMQGEHKRCSFGLVKDLALFDPRLHVVLAHGFQAVRGKPRMNGMEFCKLHPAGNVILRMAHHVAAVVDGKLYDSWDSTRRCVYAAWEVRP